MAMDDLRKAAEAPFESGCCLLVQAFNMLDEVEVSWRFAPEVQERAEELLEELMALFEGSKLHPSRGALALTAASKDEAFRHFLSVSTRAADAQRRRVQRRGSGRDSESL